MGTVWLAERVDGQFEQQVALKLVKRGMDTDAVVRRFRTERQVLADLVHPGIARLLDGGSTDEGLPYIVMERVEGLPLLAHCNQAELDVDGRLRLFRKVCDAVAFAHERGIVHRDLKPSNVLVDESGEPHLLDFGIAKVLAVAQDGPFELTRTSERFLSPRYASPEQIRGLPAGPAADVYALGIVLYELLTGLHPHGQLTTSWREFEQEVLERDPAGPSRAVLLKDATPYPEKRSVLARRLRGDLDTIVLTALRKEPERRYATAEALGADVARHLAAQPIHARPDTWRYRSAKFVRRHRGLVTGAVLFTALLLSALVVTWSLYRDSEAARREAQWVAYTASLAGAETAIRAVDAVESRTALDGAPASLRGWEWHHLAGRLDRARRTVEYAGPSSPVLALDEPRGRLAARIGLRLVLLDVDTLEPIWEKVVGGVEYICSALSTDGRWLAGVWTTREVASFYDLDSGDVRTLVAEGTERDRFAVFHPDGRLFVGQVAGRVRVVELPEGRTASSWKAHDDAVIAMDISDDGSTLVTASFDGDAAVWGAHGLELRHRLLGHRFGTYSVDIDASGARVATGSLDGTLRLWSIDSGEPLLVQDFDEGPLARPLPTRW